MTLCVGIIKNSNIKKVVHVSEGTHCGSHLCVVPSSSLGDNVDPNLCTIGRGPKHLITCIYALIHFYKGRPNNQASLKNLLD